MLFYNIINKNKYSYKISKKTNLFQLSSKIAWPQYSRSNSLPFCEPLSNHDLNFFHMIRISINIVQKNFKE